MSTSEGLKRTAVVSGGEAVVPLGDKTYTVVPQRKAYLRKKLPKALSISTEELDNEAGWSGFLDLVDQNAYSLIRLFIPDVMPEYEFNGFASEAAWKADDYDEDADHSPSVPQVKSAVMACAEVNGLDLVKHLKNFISPDFLRAFTTSQVADFLTTTSPNSSATSTPDTASTISGTSPPTPEVPEAPANGASPSPDSSLSSEPMVAVEPASASS